jgi:phosphatidate phosphatase APP1
MLNKIPVIWQLSVIKFESGTAINGVALAEVHPSTYPVQFCKRQAAAVVRSYTNKPYACKDLFILAGKELYTATTQNHGGFSLWLNGTREGNIEIYADAACNKIVPKIQSYPVYYPLEELSIEIISDIDDTILHSFTNSFFKRVSAILFTPPQQRQVVEFTKRLLLRAKETGIRVYCISRSEENLFHFLTNILSLNQLSGVIIYLSDYLNYPGLLTARKKHFKFEQISSIIQRSPGKRYYLIGDDTQNDIRTYSEIAEQFRGRICHVFIHKTKTHKTRFQKFYCERLLTLNIPVLYFDDETPFDASILKNINC